ncbi:MAG: hypothetical protein ACK5HT_02740, partial [Draconibacterium sp.]
GAVINFLDAGPNLQIVALGDVFQDKIDNCREQLKKELLILNGEVLGYKKQQRIATLTPSGLEDVFTISWVNPDGGSVNGVAKLTAAKLEISLSKDGQEEVIVLQKL